MVAALAAVAFYIAYLSVRIERQSTLDEARPAGVILVLGRGRISRASFAGAARPARPRAGTLSAELAPRILTTGGAGGDAVFTEGGVGRSYLIAHGVPSEAISVETEGETTVESIALAGEIMRRMGLRSVIVVSDGYHIFRVKQMLESYGLTVYGSPRREIAQQHPLRERWNYVKQAVGYLLWRAGMPV